MTLLCHHGSTESEILPVIHSPGLYFDPTTNIFFYNDFWKIVTHVDVNSIEPHLNEIDKLIVKSSLLCSKIEPEEYSNCRDIFNSIEVLLETNYVKAHSLSHIISKDTANRFKRALEFGGEILKFFFGTLDAEDARNYDAAIDACEKNDNEIFRLMKDNIHIVKSSINSFNSTITKLNQNEWPYVRCIPFIDLQDHSSRDTSFVNSRFEVFRKPLTFPRFFPVK
ncbi:hypothetical protein HW555_007973 [Spodoptera exigua]|uniref:Uncharacterized protein n=1 Tax=Spodoptera exigua TaxID=7107 RepID=A0A835GF72_SPOEX|nr:hypothetical protein HW555_007973 [Spodoptera exigua]